MLGLATGKKNVFVTQTQPLHSFRGLRTDYERLSFALALLELVAATVPYEQPDPDLYDFLLGALRAVEVHDKPLAALVWAELQLLSYTGFLPQFDVSVMTGSPATSDGFLSPQAGGFVEAGQTANLSDRLKVRREVLIGLARTAELPEPPANLKFAEECLIALFPFWRHIAESQLSANEAVVNELRLHVSRSAEE